MRKFAYALVAGAVLAAAALTGARAQDDQAERGHQLFLDFGCWQCHGTVGQGGAGPALLPNLHPFPVIETFVRQGTIGGMPPYTRAVLPDADLAAIYSYLQSLPPPGNPALLQGE